MGLAVQRPCPEAEPRTVAWHPTAAQGGHASAHGSSRRESQQGCPLGTSCHYVCFKNKLFFALLSILDLD